MRRAGTLAGSLGSNRRLRGEATWVLGSKLVEFGLVFALLKLLTNTLGASAYGEFNLAETAVILLTAALLVPFREAYLRDFHGAERRDESRGSGLALLRWYAAATIGVAVCAGLLTRAAGGWFEIEPLTVLAMGLIFCFDRWRFLAQDVLNVQRRRKEWALGNIGFGIAKLVLIGGVVLYWDASASSALLAYATASALFAVLIAGPMVRRILAAPPGTPSRLPSLALSFGLPFAFLLTFQWTQGFADRYLVKGLLDPMSVGLYVAAYQVCGAPYQLVLQVIHNLLTPVAYQRSWDENDPTCLWSADKVLLAGIGAHLGIGLVLFALYAAFGVELLVLLTSESFAVTGGVVLALAAARYLQTTAQSLQPIFAVHHEMSRMLWLRMLGAVLTVALCWPLTQEYGIFGTAVGSCVAFALYLAILVFAPSGVYCIVSGTRRAALETGFARPPQEPEPAWRAEPGDPS